MADQDRAVPAGTVQSGAVPSGAVQPTTGSAGAGPNGAIEGRVAQGGPDAIVAEIERTRANLAATIDALAERVSPASNMRKLRERAQEQLGRKDVQLAATAAGLVVVAVVILRVWGKRRK